MAGKDQNRKAHINELIADNKWDQVQRERDSLKVERIKKLEGHSNVFVVLGALLLFGAYDFLLDAGKTISANMEETGADKAADLHTLLNGIEPKGFVLILVAALAGLIFFFLAAKKNESIEKLNAARYIWMPDKDENAYIEARFDNDFVRSVLSDISSEGTYSIEVGLDAVTVNNNTGPLVRNYNKCGFRSLTNHDTKQLAYYLASHSFPEGFTIYQTRNALAGAERFIGGVTDVGGDRPPEEDETRHSMRILSRLFEQVKEIFRINKMKNPFEVAPEGPAAAYNGQIVVNKGFKDGKEGLADL